MHAAWLAGLGPALALVWLVMRGVVAIVVVPVAEELAFRGLLYRLLIARDFETVRFGQLSWLAVAGSALAFGVMHQRWLAGLMAGVVLALVMVRHGPTDGCDCRPRRRQCRDRGRCRACSAAGRCCSSTVARPVRRHAMRGRNAARQAVAARVHRHASAPEQEHAEPYRRTGRISMDRLLAEWAQRLNGVAAAVIVLATAILSWGTLTPTVVGPVALLAGALVGAVLAVVICGSVAMLGQIMARLDRLEAGDMISPARAAGTAPRSCARPTRRRTRTSMAPRRSASEMLAETAETPEELANTAQYRQVRRVPPAEGADGARHQGLQERALSGRRITRARQAAGSGRAEDTAAGAGEGLTRRLAVLLAQRPISSSESRTRRLP